MLRGDAGAVVADLDLQLIAAEACGEQDTAAGRRVAHRVGDQVADNALDHYRIGMHPGAAGTNPKHDLLVGGIALEGGADALEQRRQREGADIRADAGNVEAGDVEQRIEQLAQCLRRGRDLLGEVGQVALSGQAGAQLPLHVGRE